MTLTLDLVSRIESGAYVLFSFEVGIKIWCMHASFDGDMSYTTFWSL